MRGKIGLIHPSGVFGPIAAANLEGALGVIVVTVELELIAGQAAEGFHDIVGGPDGLRRTVEAGEFKTQEPHAGKGFGVITSVGVAE